MYLKLPLRSYFNHLVKNTQDKRILLMKKKTLLLVLVLVATIQLQAETVYLNVSGSCLDHMEYELAKNNQVTKSSVYRLSPQNNTHLFLDAGSNKGSIIDNIPHTPVSCAVSDTWGLKTVQRINRGELSVFLVRQTPQGYHIQKVNTAAWSEQWGQNIKYVAQDFDFETNVSTINYGKNLASTQSQSEISMDNLMIYDCSSMMTMRQSPNRANVEQSSFQFIPEIGIVSVAYGWDPSKSTTKKTLKAINGISYTQHLSNVCNSNATVSTIVMNEAHPVSYDKEVFITKNVPIEYVNTTTVYNPNLKLHRGSDNIPANAIHVGHIDLTGQATTTAVTVEELKVVADTPKVTPTVKPATVIIKKQKKEVPQSYDIVSKVVLTESVPTEFSAKSVVTNPCGASAEHGYHLVLKGETLYRISKKYGQSIDQLKAWNGLSDNTIKPCMALRVSESGAPNPAVVEVVEKPVVTQPAPVIKTEVKPQPVVEKFVVKGNESRTDMKWLDQKDNYTVQEGDNVASLANRFGYTTERFRYINGMTPTETLRVGQILRTTDCNCLNTPQPYETVDAVISTPETTEFTPKGGETTLMMARSVENFSPTSYDAVSVAPIGKLVHVVEAGETVYSLAKRYNTTPEVIYQLNGMDKGEVIIPAQRLYVK